MDLSDRYARLGDRSDMALIKDMIYGNIEALEEIMDRYLDLVSRTSFRILCDRVESEYVIEKVFIFLWNDVFEYDDRFTLREWLLKKTYKLCRRRIARRRILRFFGVVNDVFVNVAPKVDDYDDYVTKQAWEMHCRAVNHMTTYQSAVYAMCVIDNMPEEAVAEVTVTSRMHVEMALDRAVHKVKCELRSYGKEKDYSRYNAFLRKVADSLTDYGRLRREILLQLGIK